MHFARYNIAQGMFGHKLLVSALLIAKAGIKQVIYLVVVWVVHVLYLVEAPSNPIAIGSRLVGENKFSI